MKNNNYKIFLLVLIVVSFLYSCGNKKDTTKAADQSKKMTALTFNYNEDYGTLWDEVAAHEKKGLYKSAITKVEEIFTEAKKDKNTPQVVKALIYKMKYNAYLEENNYIKALNELQQISIDAEFPLKQILHSITAESYWSYYQANQWKINQRTHSSEFKNDDISTWDLQTISNKTAEQYLLSLTSKDSLQHAKISDFKTIIHYSEETEKLQPTLYDFLGARAISFFENTQHNLTKPADYFTLKDKKYFEGFKQFVSTKIKSNDSASNLYNAILIYQELASFQYQKKNFNSVIHYSLSRLKFVKNNSNNPLKKELYLQGLEQLKKEFPKKEEISTVDSEIAKWYFEKGEDYNLITGDNQWEKQKALEICEEVIANFPNSYGAKECWTLKYQIEQKSIGIKIEKSQRPNKAIRMVMNHKNVSKLYFKLVKVDWDFQYKLTYGVLDELEKLPVLKKWEENLKDVKDYQEHQSDLKLEELPFGKYYVLASSSPSFTTEKNAVSYTNFWVTNISYAYEKNNSKGVEILVVDSDSGVGLKGVTVQQYSYSYNNRKRTLKKRTKYITDNFGKTTIAPHKTSRYSNEYYFYFKKGEDEYFTERAIYQYRSYEQPSERTVSTTFFIDRDIYRPGQTVYFKGIVLGHYKKEHYIEPNSKHTVTLFDVNYQKVANLELTTNEFGTFAGSFTLPMGTMNGRFHIGDDKGGQKYFRVEEYKRPKFEVNFNPIKGSYKLNQEVSIKGNAKAFAGYFLDDAVVKYRVKRTARFPYWCWYRWGYSPTSPAIEIENGTIKTDENGEFAINFKALADESVEAKYSPTFTYEVSVDVTDLNGETQSNTTYISVGYNAMELSIGIGDKVNKQKEQEVAINATNLNGEKINATGTITITKLIEPNRIYRKALLPSSDIKTIDETTFHQLFPYDAYSEENKIEHLKKGEVISTLLFNTERKDKFILPISNMSIGRYVVEAKTTDEFGTEVIDIRYFTMYDASAKTIPTNQTWWTTDLKLNAEPGENATFLIGTAEKELLVTYQIEHQGKSYTKNY